MSWLFIGIGGFFGAISRFYIGQLLKSTNQKIPYATILVNMLGSFLFGAVIGLGIKNNVQDLYLFLTGGFLGAFTTFSTFTYESVSMLQQKEKLKSFLYIGTHLFMGVVMAALGFYLI